LRIQKETQHELYWFDVLVGKLETIEGEVYGLSYRKFHMGNIFGVKKATFAQHMIQPSL
jgi:hypothetical protein